MKVLVTGGAGFIGSHLVDRLLADGHEVVVLDNLSTGKRENIIDHRRLFFFLGDVAGVNSVTAAFSFGPFDAVFHVAGQASIVTSFEDPQADLRTNILGTVNLLQLCVQHGVRRFLYASSMTVYGHPTSLPVAENHLLCPVSCYGISKMAAERYVHATAGIDATSFRMFNVYGKRQLLDNPYQGVAGIFIGNVLRGEPITIYGGGEQSRDFVHVLDVVDAWMLALHNPAASGQVFNLGTGASVSVNELAELLGALEVIRAPRRPGEQLHMAADITLAREKLGWAPKIELEEGLADTVAWAMLLEEA